MEFNRLLAMFREQNSDGGGGSWDGDGSAELCVSTLGDDIGFGIGSSLYPTTHGGTPPADGCRRSRDTYQDEILTEISGERRQSRRYALHLELQYKVMPAHQIQHVGTGRTVDLSSAGVAFTTTGALPVGARIELGISWPVLLNRNCPLKLVVAGKVIRSAPSLTAVRMERYEFRTVGSRGIRMMTAGAPI
jgi:hypothetical protein